MFSNNRTTQAVRLALTFGVASGALFSTTAMAQEAQEAKKVERIEVTGSRIKRTDMETAQPVLAITADDIARSGLVSVGDILKEISTNGAALVYKPTTVTLAVQPGLTCVTVLQTVLWCW